MSMMNFVRSLRGRKTHVYCIGAAKTGTTSIAQIYNKVYRTAHEPEVEQTTGCVMDYLSGRLSETECAKRLMARDKRLNLEMESSHPLGYFTPLLVSSFPDAKFLVTIRDPRSWIKSRINFHLNKTPPEWKPYRDFIWARHHTGFSKEEQYLEALGLFSLEAYLKQYAEQYRIIFDAVPEERLMVLKTSEISESVGRISDFVGYEGKALAPVHTNKLADSVKIHEKIPPEFIDAKVEECCGWLMKAYF
ncbi:sulfotransferase [Enterovibrio paralichthyis]|uniref:sulfotransferase n=1 Tax=Enterovibrio paralichthyis TaxID=2853805 RepID=UPI001C48816A|nr:sulfotransferase [Enterovibrio paralichthyis]MBV7299786.1 sulfotransferase domain-containing protein [Enterovibrio paralichthyis]